MTKSTLPNRQRGLSMVGLLLGIGLSASFIVLLEKMYITHLQAERFAHANVVVQETGRFAIQDITRIVAAAGLDLLPDDQLNDVSAIHIYPEQAFLEDKLTVRYRRDNGCRNHVTLPSEQPQAIHATTISFDRTSGRLMCQDNGGRREALVEGIFGISILYGIDGGTRTDGFTDRYVSAQQLLAGNYTSSHIRSLRISLLVSSDQALFSPTSVSETQIQQNKLDIHATAYDLATDIAPTNPRLFQSAEKQLFEVFETTILLRNHRS